ncbi:ribbon-helix-helix protein, CopG family [Haladaptatus salinisoli]|uniref:ribbon-helix-helix protein, CopG family n=1 Tax=Haladaptatus salinisoli TaxID=2884876 RepID=UPI001D0A241E|nr:ribbon-helix-helix protein, CopG family [Haladaptatus salinisoli]
MGNKNKTISFRVNEDAFETLREIAEKRDISLSAVFRDYVDMLVAHDGKIRVVPENQVEESDGESFPPKVEVPKSFVREHERLELEAEHLREQLQEHKQFVRHLQTKVDDEAEEEVIQLEELDDEMESDEPFRLG